MNELKQAAILCGGLGTRLMPLTKDVPKPMVMINNRPFIVYLIDQLIDKGIENILLMTGYMGEKIIEYFSNGFYRNIEIKISSGPSEWLTGRRLIEARSLLEDRFLLLYCDNYVQVPIDKLKEFHFKHDGFLTLTLSSKKPGNVFISNDGKIIKYNKKRNIEDMEYVDVGYMIVERDEVLSRIVESNIDLSDIMTKLIDEGKVAGWIVKDQYHSIGDLKRLEITKEYLKEKRILFFDRDGVINKRPKRAEYIKSWSDFLWIENTVHAMEKLSKHGFSFIIISNQAGIARGIVTKNQIDSINTRMIQELNSRGIIVLDTYMCTHHWNDGCSCRKPEPGMFFQAARDHLVRLDRTFYIGDDPRDCIAAYNAGSKCIYIGKKNELEDLYHDQKPVIVIDKLTDSVDYIIENFRNWENMI